jgi:pyrimidine operon attenuation protein/uracil phosphoribosyltransferase
MKPYTLIDSALFSIVINRLCYQLIENHNDFSNCVLIGLQPRGMLLAHRIASQLKDIQPGKEPLYGTLDVTFHRDDFRRSDKTLIAHDTAINLSLEDKEVILVDDVLYTGRTIRSGLEAMLDFGRPRSVELLVLIDRRFSRELPIEPKYIGQSVDSYDNQKVKVVWDGDGRGERVVLLTETT